MHRRRNLRLDASSSVDSGDFVNGTTNAIGRSKRDMDKLLEMEVAHLFGHKEGFLTPDITSAQSAQYEAAFREFSHRLANKRLPISTPLYETDYVAEIRHLAEKLKANYESVLIIGIGGSTL